MNQNEVVNYPTEFLNSLDLPDMPTHILTLKIGVPIILLRNINPPRLCNGTRLSVKKMMNNIIEATILNGKFKGGDFLLPRIPMITTDMQFEFKRLQFPVRLDFAMTINKAQGQSLQVCGLNLENPCFSHGQLYVVCSRVENLPIYSCTHLTEKQKIFFIQKHYNKKKNNQYYSFFKWHCNACRVLASKFTLITPKCKSIFFALVDGPHPNHV